MKATASFIGRIASVKYEVLNNTSTGRETPRLTLQIITTKLVKINNNWEERTSSFFVNVWNQLATSLHTKKTIEKGFLVGLETEISTRSNDHGNGNIDYFIDFNLESFVVIQKPQAWFENRKSTANQAPQDAQQELPNTRVANSAPPVSPSVNESTPSKATAMPEGPIDDDIPF